MPNQNPEESADARLEHFDNVKLGSGARDTGEDAPEPGQEGRPVGTVDEDANPPITVSETYGATGELPPQDTGSAIPPYEGRKQAGEVAAADSQSSVGADAGGARGPVVDPDYKSPSPADTPGGPVKSPADEQPAAQAPETDLDDDRVGPSHVPGAGAGESKS
jgi:hypothetical protein